MTELNAIQDPGRRALLQGRFAKSNSPGEVKVLRPVGAIAQQVNGVIWALEVSARNDIFFAGDDGYMFRYDGETWHRENFPSDLPVHTLCRGNDDIVYAAGWLGVIAARRENEWQILQGGKRVSDSDSPDAIRVNLPLFDMTSTIDSTIWAVGDQGRVVRSNGENWEEIDSGVNANLRCILPFNDNSILVGGLGGTVLHYRDAQWEKIDTQTNCPIISMVSAGTGEIFAVGGEYDAETSSFVGRVFQYNGIDWSEVQTGQSLPRLRKIRRDNDVLLIVGDGGFATKIDQRGATQLHTNVRYDLHDIAVHQNGITYVCGDGGTVLKESVKSNPDTDIGIPLENSLPSSWRNISPEFTKKSLRGVWCARENLVYAVGDSGTVIKYDGQKWINEIIPTNIRLHGIWGSSPKNIFAVGDNSTILHFDGDDWSICYKGEVDVALLAITGFGTHDIFVVGDNGMALRFDGVNWRRTETGTQYELYAIWGFDSEHVLAVGGAGVLLRWNGEQWQLFNAGTDNDMYGIWGESLDQIYLCGLSSTLINYSDNSWKKQFTGDRNDLHAISGSPGGPVYAIGSQGGILQKSDGQWRATQSDTNSTLHAISVIEGLAFAVGSEGCVIQGTLA